MPTNKVERLSEIIHDDSSLGDADLLLLGSSSSGIKTVNTVSVNDTFKYIEDDIKTNGFGQLVIFGEGISGIGTSANPLKLDRSYFDSMLIPVDSMNITTVGYRNLRFLPISRSSLYTHTGYDSRVSTKPAIALESQGDIKMIQAGSSAYTSAIAEWSSSRNLLSKQIIERRLKFPKNANINEVIIGVSGNTASMAVVITKNSLSGYISYWGVTLQDGSLKDQSYTDQFLIATDDPLNVSYYANLKYFSTGAFSILKKTDGSIYLFNTVSQGREFECNLIRRPSSGGVTLTAVTRWVATSYAGTVSTTGSLKLSTEIASTTATNGAEILLTGVTGGWDATGTTSGKEYHRFTILQNDKDFNDISLLSYCEYKLTVNSRVQKYVLPMLGTITLTGTTTGSFMGVGVSLINRPELNYSGTQVTITNDKFLPMGSISSSVSEEYYILNDGTLCILQDRTDSKITLLTPPKPIDIYVGGVDLISEIKSNYTVHGEWSLAPEYLGTTTSSKHNLYIASSVPVQINKGTYALPAQILELDTVLTNAPVMTITDIAYTNGRYRGVQVKAVYIYVEEVSGIVRLQLRSSAVTESVNSTLLASVYFPTDNSPAILFGQSYSRLGSKRLNYSPAGSSVPVSYNQPHSPPVSIWGPGSQVRNDHITLWKNSACTIPGSMFTPGDTAYAKIFPINNRIDSTFTLRYAGNVVSSKVFDGTPMVWGFTVWNDAANITTQQVSATSTYANYGTVTDSLYALSAALSFDFINELGEISDYFIEDEPFFMRTISPLLKVGDVVRFEVTKLDTGTNQSSISTVDVTYTAKGASIPLTGIRNITFTGRIYSPRLNVWSGYKSAYSPSDIYITWGTIGKDNLNGTTVDVIQHTYDLYEYAKSVLGREPVGVVRFINVSQVIVGDGRGWDGQPGHPAINVGTGWIEGTRVELINYGWIFGRGGNGWTQGVRSQNGGVGIVGGNVPLYVTNSGVISGGGGGGGHDQSYHDGGGGGAPYGMGGWGSKFTSSGGGLTRPGRLERWNTHIGGAIGQRGSNGGWDDTEPGNGGATSTGEVYITNVGTGHTGYL